MQVSDADDQFWAISCGDAEIEAGCYYVGRRKRPRVSAAEDAVARRDLWNILEAQATAAAPLGGLR